MVIANHAPIRCPRRKTSIAPTIPPIVRMRRSTRRSRAFAAAASVARNIAIEPRAHQPLRAASAMPIRVAPPNNILIPANRPIAQSADPGKPISHPAVSQGGDQWLPGEHRLVCGNAGQPGVYASADHAIRSWQMLAGRPATLASTAKTFAEIEEERNGRSDAGSDQSVPAKREAA